MAHSCIEYNGAHAFIRDADVILTAYLLMDYAERNLPDEEQDFVRSWRTDFEWMSAGTIDLELDKHFNGGNGKVRLISLLNNTRKNLLSDQDVVSGQFLNSLINSPGVYKFGDLKSADIAAVFDKFLSVVNSNEKSA